MNDHKDSIVRLVVNASNSTALKHSCTF